MLDTQEIQTLAQLIDNLDILVEKFEKSYRDNDAEDFQNSKKEILETQTKISKVVEENEKVNY